MSSSLLELGRSAARMAERHGADAAKVLTGRSRAVLVEWRNGKLDRVQERTERSLSVAVFVNQRSSEHSTNDIRPEALDRFVRDAVVMTQLLEPDTFRSLPDASRYATESERSRNLDLFDAAQADESNDQRLGVAQELEQLARQSAGKLPVASISSSVRDSVSERARIHTNGFEGAHKSTHFSRSVVVTVADEGGKRPAGAAMTSRRHKLDLESPQSLAALACERAGLRLGAGKLHTGSYSVILDRRAVGQLLRPLLRPLHGESLQQKRSLWDGKLGQRIVSPKLTLIDEPHVLRGLGSAKWDSDGFAVRTRPLIVDGVLRTFLIDDYYARKLQTHPTGARTHNLLWPGGSGDLDSLVSQVGHGVYLDRFIGGNSNESTGDVSVGCAGRVIENGKLGRSVVEINLAGQIGRLWSGLSMIGADPDPNSPIASPTLVFENVQLSGV